MMKKINESTEEPYQQQLKNLKAIQLYRQLLTLSRNRSPMTNYSWLLWFIGYSGQLKMEKHE